MNHARKKMTSTAQKTTRAFGAGAFLVAALLTSGVPAEDLIQVGFGQGEPGDQTIRVIITATNDLPIHGYSLALTFPQEALTLTDFSVSGTHVAAMEPAVFPTVNNTLGVALLGVILDYAQAPFSPRALAPLAEDDAPRIIARLTFSVKADAPGGLYPLSLVDGIGNPATYNRFTEAGTSIVPELRDGSFFVAGGNLLTLERKRAFCGATPQVEILARAQHPDDLAGFSIAIAYDCTLVNLDLDETGFNGTDLGRQLGSAGLIEFFQTDIDTSFGANRCRSRTAAVFDFVPPFIGQTLNASPNTTQTIMRYLFRPENANIDCMTTDVLDLTLEDLDAPGSLNNVFLVQDRSITPRLVHGKIYFSTGDLTGRVLDAVTGTPISGVSVVTEPDDLSATTAADGTFTIADMIPGTFSLKVSKTDYYTVLVSGVTVAGGGATTNSGDIFIYEVPETIIVGNSFRRGFINVDNRFDLSDAIGLFNFLFRGRAAPVCEQAADTNGDARVDLSDGVFLLQYLFRGGRAPPPPFEECGPVDPAHPRGFTCDAFPPAVCP